MPSNRQVISIIIMLILLIVFIVFIRWIDVGLKFFLASARGNVL